MFESFGNSHHARFAETTWNIFQIFTNKDVADLKIVLSNILQTCHKIKRLPKRSFRCFAKHDVWRKTLFLKTFRICMSHLYNVLKALHQQIAGTATLLFRPQDF